MKLNKNQILVITLMCVSIALQLVLVFLSLLPLQRAIYGLIFTLLLGLYYLNLDNPRLKRIRASRAWILQAHIMILFVFGGIGYLVSLGIISHVAKGTLYDYRDYFALLIGFTIGPVVGEMFWRIARLEEKIPRAQLRL
jgi:hypothetical protein